MHICDKRANDLYYGRRAYVDFFILWYIAPLSGRARGHAKNLEYFSSSSTLTAGRNAHILIILAPL